MSIDHWTIRAVVASVALSATATAFSQDKLRDPAAAEALYLSGRKLVTEGNWAEGCEKFRASLDLNPAASTLINIAKCSEHEGKLTQALVEYRRALQVNQDTLGEDRRKKLEQVVKEGIASLEPRLAKVQLVVKNRPTGVEIKRDGLVFPIATIGETIPLDPGEHVFVLTAPGFRTEERKVTLKEGETSTVEMLLVEEEKPAIVPEVPKDKPVLEDKPIQQDKPVVPDKPSGGVPTWAFVAGGAGLLAVGAGVFFKLQQADAEQALKDNCGEELLCDPTKPYNPADDNAKKNQSFGLFVGLTAVGVAGIGAAVVGIVRGVGQAKPQQSSWVVAPWAGRSEGGVVVRGAF